MINDETHKATLEQFTVGRIDAPIVIELGLGYWSDHLSGDREKLTNSRVQHPYLAHLSRMPSGYQEETEVIIAGIEAPAQIAPGCIGAGRLVVSSWQS